tara:strand:- start:336 stop:1016 length:681 start_codon:yes stop_codon:yes gene_type:complete
MYKKKKIVALITARANSQRLKKKNFLTIFKKPLIFWTISSALKSKYLDNIFVSSDMDEILKYSKKYKRIKLIKRKKYLSRSDSSIHDVINNFLKNQKERFDYICLLQPTSPLRRSSDIDVSIKKIINTDCMSLISVSKMKNHNFKVSLDKKCLLKKKIKKTKYFINGAIYISKINFKKKIRNFMTPKTLGYIMPKNRSIDIDTLEDFKKAEIILKKNKKFNQYSHA